MEAGGFWLLSHGTVLRSTVFYSSDMLGGYLFVPFFLRNSDNPCLHSHLFTSAVKYCVRSFSNDWIEFSTESSFVGQAVFHFENGSGVTCGMSCNSVTYIRMKLTHRNFWKYTQGRIVYPTSARFFA